MTHIHTYTSITAVLQDFKWRMLELSVRSEVQITGIRSSLCNCHPVISCCIKIQLGLTFLVLAYPGSPEKEALKWVSICLLDMPYATPNQHFQIVD